MILWLKDKWDMRKDFWDFKCFGGWLVWCTKATATDNACPRLYWSSDATPVKEYGNRVVIIWWGSEA